MTTKINGHSVTHPTNVWSEKTRTREWCFKQIKKAAGENLAHTKKNSLVISGDSLSVLRSLPDHCVSLILTDPPYHATKKANIFGDKAFAKDEEYIAWMEQYSNEWRRVLKLNGSLFCFCVTSMAARLDVMLSKHFNMLSHVVWTKPNDPGFDGWKGKMKKEALRQWYAHSERVLFAEPAIEGSLFRSPFAKLLSDARKLTGMSMHEVTGAIGAHGKVNHGGAVSNWEAGRNTPSRKQYEDMVELFLSTGKVKSMPPYDDAIRVFDMDSSRQFTDVWDFPSVRPYKGKHPAEKPLGMLQHAIEATTREGDIVLDCFAGSGSTAIASLNLGRRTVAIEIEENWVEYIADRIEDHVPGQSKIGTCRAPKSRKERKLQPGLFSET